MIEGANNLYGDPKKIQDILFNDPYTVLSVGHLFNINDFYLVSDSYQSLYEQWSYTINIAGNVFSFSELGVFIFF